MAAEVLHLRSPLRWSKDWSQQEIAEFYRVESALVQAGFALQTDRGLSDEGEPWFVFCRVDTGDVFIHFARIDGEYVVDAGLLGPVLRGSDFRTLVRDIVEKQPLVQARAKTSNNIFLHPAALLIALVGGAFFHSNEAKAATSHADHAHGHADWKRQLLLSSGPSAADTQSQILDSAQVAAILTGVMFALDRQIDLAPPPAPSSSTPAPLPLMTSFDLKVVPPVHGAATAISFQITPTFGGGGGGGGGSGGGNGPQGPLGFAAADHAAAIHLNLAAPTETPLFWPEALAAPTMASFQVTPTFGGGGGGGGGVGDAAQVIQWAELSADQTPPAILQATQLPVQLTNLLSHGKHPAPGPPENLQPTPGLDQDTTQSTQPAQPTTVNIPAATGFDPHDPAVSAAVASFFSGGHVLGEIIVGTTIVIYDTAIMHPLLAGTTLDSITFNFTDHTSLSLVGTAAEIQALNWAQ